MVEWGILALVLLGVVWFFGQHAKRIQSQAERAQVLTTLGALRTAMVLGQLQIEVQGRKKPVVVLPVSANPFDTLGTYPPNYGGEVTARDVAGVLPGQWVYDAQCACIGYKPTYPDGLESQENLDALWFQRRAMGVVGVLVPLDRYIWDGQKVE
jgi:hypothetical protein